MSKHRVAKLGFNKDALVYDKARPDYAPLAVQHLLQHRKPKVLEIAAGTGIFTKHLPKQDLVCVEPSEAMRSVFQRKFPDVPLFAYSSDKMEFAQDAFRTVYVAQAFHWFADRESVHEIARVLEPGGTLGLVWNLEDEETQWVKAIRSIYEQYEQGTPQFRLGLWRKIFETKETKQLFGPLEEVKFKHQISVKRDMIWQRVLSKSYIQVLDTKEQESAKTRIEATLDEHLPKCQAEIVYPQVTTVALARRLPHTRG
ncbi:S-adenosyl-L-methionine-dependent methyltransferase [Gorgonomyces haynaldii]|nr:S-adenosyl-L-methionine-dependent methyltransferase [Gorgonomyces haynaldii]